MLDAELEPFLAPIAGPSPSGENLQYDETFRKMQDEGEDKPAVQYGEKIIDGRPPQWKPVRDYALELAARTHDLRVAVWLVRSGARLSGLRGYVAGLQLVQGLLEAYWPSVHPLLDASDRDDPTERMSALMPLAAPGAGLADLRSASLTGQRGGLTVREIELACARSPEPFTGEVLPVKGQVLEAIRQLEAADGNVLELLRAGRIALAGIEAVVDAHVTASARADLEPAARVLRLLSDAADEAAGVASGSPAPGPGDPDPASQGAPAVAAPGAITSREDAVAALERVCVWLERNEPSSPAPLLIRRSQRLISKNFLDIIRDLAPDTLDQIVKLAGIEPS